ITGNGGIPVLQRGACQVNVTSWKQFTPWGANPYNQSYRTISYPSLITSIILPGTSLQLTNGFSSCPISLSAAQNNLTGLANFIANNCSGVNVVGPTRDVNSDGTLDGYYLSLYNTKCLTENCAPRVVYPLELQLSVGALTFPLLQPKT